MVLRRTRPGPAPPKGDLQKYETFFCDFIFTMKEGTLTRFWFTEICLCRIKILAWWILLANPCLNTIVCNLLSKKSCTFNDKTWFSVFSDSFNIPYFSSLRIKDAPWICLFKSDDGKVNNKRADDLILDKINWTLQTSLLFFKPYSPINLSSDSILSFSKGLLGVLYVLEPWFFFSYIVFSKKNNLISVKTILTISIIFTHLFILFYYEHRENKIIVWFIYKIIFKILKLFS